MTDFAQGFGWWQASDGKWYAPGHGPDAAPPTPEGGPDAAAPGVTPAAGDGSPIDVHPAPPAETPSTPPSRARSRRPKVILDSGFWVLLWVIGAIVLVALIIVAVSQVSPAPKKGQAATRRAVVVPAVRPVAPRPSRTRLTESVVDPAVAEPVEGAPDVGQLVG